MNINDPRIVNILDETKLTRTVRGAYVTVLVIVERANHKHRKNLWAHFEKNPRLPLLPRLHIAFDIVEAETNAGKIDPQSPLFDARAYGNARLDDRKKQNVDVNEGETAAP